MRGGYEHTTRCGMWLSLGGEHLYRVTECFSIDWDDVHLKKSIVTCAPNGGLISLSDAASNYNSVQLRTSTGTPCCRCNSFALPHADAVRGMQWMQRNDVLLMLTLHNNVFVYKTAGERCAELQVSGAIHTFAFSGDALVVLVHDAGVTSLLYLACDAKGTLHSNAVQLPAKVTWSTASLLPMTSEDSSAADVALIAADDNSNCNVYVCSFDSGASFRELKVSLEGGRVVRAACSPSGRHIALHMSDGTLLLTSPTFDVVTQIATARCDRMTQLTFVDEACVAYVERDDDDDNDVDTCCLILVNVNDSDVTDCIHDVPGDVVLVHECDGVRMLHSSGVQFVQIVPPEVQRVFVLGSRAPAALLLSAFDEFMTSNATAVSMMQELQAQPERLLEAIRDCVVAASFEMDVQQQKRLLRIAALGKSFCAYYDSNTFVDTVQRIRLRNTLRTSPTVGMLMTHVQLCALGDERLVQRLLKLDAFELADSVSLTLNLPRAPVVYAWAKRRLAAISGSSVEKERAVARQVASKAASVPQISFAELAKEAFVLRRTTAALVFVEHEKAAMRQIPMLLSMDKADMALRRAVSVGDADLLFTVMQYTMHTQSASAAASALAASPDASLLLRTFALHCEATRNGEEEAVVEAYFAAHPDAQLQTMLLQLISKGNTNDVCVLHELLRVAKMMISVPRAAASSSPSPPPSQHMLSAGLSDLATLFSPTAASSASLPQRETTSAAMHFHTPAECIEAHTALVELQTSLAAKYDDTRFVHASVLDVLRLLLERGAHAQARELRVRFGVSEKMWQWCQFRVHLMASEWQAIDVLLRDDATAEGKCVLPASAVVRQLLAQNRTEQAQRYVPRISRLEQRMEYYVQCDAWASAAAECRRQNDADLLQQLRERAKGNVTLLQQVDEGWSKAVTPEPATTTLKLSRLFA